MRAQFCLGILITFIVTALAGITGAEAALAVLRQEVLTPGTFSTWETKNQETLQLKLKAPGYVERIFIALTAKSAQTRVIVSVNGRPRKEIVAPFRLEDFEVDVRDQAASIEFFAVSGSAQVDGVIVVTSVMPADGSAQAAAESVHPASASGRPSDILKLMKTADRDLETLSRYMQPEDIANILVPAQSAVREVVILARAGRAYSDILPAIRVLKTKLQKLDPIVTRMRSVMSRTERELANSIYIWTLDIQGLAD